MNDIDNHWLGAQLLQMITFALELNEVFVSMQSGAFVWQVSKGKHREANGFTQGLSAIWHQVGI